MYRWYAWLVRSGSHLNFEFGVGCTVSAPWISWSRIIGIGHAAVPPRHWRTAWEDAVTPRSFVNGYWTLSWPDAASRTSPATLVSATKRCTAGAGKTESTADLRAV